MDLLQECQEHANKYYCDLLAAAQKNLEDSLFSQAESCSSNEEQRLYFEAMQELKNRSGSMTVAFRDQLNNQFQAFVSGNDVVPSIEDKLDVGTLSLVQRDELEDELAISVIVSKANSRNSETLWKLNRRLAVLRKGKAVTDESNPFGPASVGNALRAAVTQLTLENKARIIIYKQLGKIFVVSFAKELGALNELLTEKGILPNLKFSAAAKQAAATAPSAPEAPEPGDAAAGSESLLESTSAIAHQRELYNSISALLNQAGPKTQTSGGVSFGHIGTDGSGGQDSFSAIEFALALSAIQQSKQMLQAAQSRKPVSVDAVEKAFVSQLEQQASEDGHNKMTRDDANTVDLVGMIFRYMLDDEKLHDAVKSLLSHLHTPYLKLALMDKTFLNNYEHNARILLNAMADVGGRWVKDEEDRTVLPKIKTIVESILKGFIDDVTIFDRLLEDFSRFKESLEKRAKMVEKRNTEAQQGLEKLEISKQRAGEEVKTRLDKAKVPELAQKLLLQPWTDFLAFNLLRHGEESLTWESALKVLEGVIWSVKPGQASDSKEDLHRRQNELEQTVAEGLQTIGYDNEASKQLLSSLREAQELVYHDAVMDEVKESQSHATEAAERTTTERPQLTAIERQTIKAAALEKRLKAKQKQEANEPPLSSEEKSMVEKLREIAFGTWFEFDKPDKALLLKLAWFSRVTAHYMFVDQAGIKQVVETQNNLARGMCSGQIRIVQPGKKSFMERALEAVFDKLKLT